MLFSLKQLTQQLKARVFLNIVCLRQWNKRPLLMLDGENNKDNEKIKNAQSNIKL